MNIRRTQVGYHRSRLSSAFSPAHLSAALLSSFSLLPFFWGIKLYLYLWYRLGQDVHPLSMVPAGYVPLLGALDVAVCLALGGGYAMLLIAGDLLGKQVGQRVARGVIVGTHMGIVAFSVVSMKVNQVYGMPLVMTHIHMMDDVQIMMGSLLAYLDVDVVIAFVLGAACFWGIPYLMRHRTPRIHAFVIGRPLVVGAILSMVTLGTVWGAYTAFDGVYSYGLKRNPLVAFVQYYEASPGAVDVDDLYRQWNGRYGAGADTALTAASLHPPAAPTGTADSLRGVAAGYDVLFILLESMGAGYLDAETMPTLHALKQHSLSLPNYFTSSSSSFSSAYSVFYSDYLGLEPHPANLYPQAMPQPSLVEAFQQVGYGTAVFQSGFLSYTDFDYLWRGKGTSTIVGGREIIQQTGHVGWAWGAFEEQTVDRLADWVRAVPDTTPFFAVYRPVFPHHPYTHPLKAPPFPEQDVEGQYRNALYYVDQNIAQLLKHLKQAGRLERTLVVAVADHGETVTNTAAGHGIALTDKELRVPFMVSHPTLFNDPVSLPVYANHLDLAPTLMALVGGPIPTAWRGRDVLSNQQPRVFYLMKTYSAQYGLIDQGLLVDVNANGPAVQFYELQEGRERRLLPDHAIHDTLKQQYVRMATEAQDLTLWSHIRRAHAASLEGLAETD